MATYERRGKVWRAKVRRKGFASESASFDSKAAALEWATKREAELQDVRHGKVIERTVAQGLERYREEIVPSHEGARWEAIRCLKLERTLPFAGRFISQVQPSDIAAWRDHALAGDDDTQPLKPASVRREWSLLRGMFEVARKEWGWGAANPMDDVRRPAKPPARKSKWSPDEIERVVLALGYERWHAPTTISHRVALAFLFALETAMRQGEICGLVWEHVHLEDRYVHLPKTKNGDDRDVPLTKRAVDILRLLPGEHLSVFNLDASQIDALFRKAKRRAEIVDVRFHDARANGIERMTERLDILEVARAVGHRDLKSLLVYYRKNVTEIAKRLDE